MTTVADALNSAGDRFARVGLESPRLQARQLLSKAIGYAPTWVYQHFQEALPLEQVRHYEDLVTRRATGEPLPYILGEIEFYGRPFFVDERVLVPRPETEELVEHALAYARRRRAVGETVRSILDVGTGSGVIALSLARELPEARVVAVDRSWDALQVARTNRERHELGRRAFLVQGDLLSGIDLVADLIVANLPYIPSRQIDQLQVEVRREPRVALDGGDDGLAVYRRLFDQVSPILAAPGIMIAEIGADQGDEAMRLAGGSLPSDIARVVPDLSGRDRFLVVERGARAAG